MCIQVDWGVLISGGRGERGKGEGGVHINFIPCHAGSNHLKSLLLLWERLVGGGEFIGLGVGWGGGGGSSSAWGGGEGEFIGWGGGSSSIWGGGSSSVGGVGGWGDVSPPPL